MGMLPTTTPEQRAAFYEDVEDFTSVGFISHSLSLAGARLSFRSLSAGDLFLIRTHGDDEDWQAWMVASSIWMVDGFSLLGETNSPYHIHKMLKDIPRSTMAILFSIVKGLFSRQDQAIGAVEAYCYENASRFRWKATKGSSIGTTSGIQGTSRFGLNSVMQMWRFFNEVEDKRSFDEAQWDGFKLSASASSPKGVEKIDKHDRSRREREENRRQDVLDRFYYIRKGVLSSESKPTDTESIGIRAKSYDDLEGEMQRWVSGDEDFHDKIVSSYKNSITSRYDREQDDRAARREMLQKKYEEMELDTKPQPLVGYTLDQLEHVVKSRKPGVAHLYHDTQGTQEKLYQRHLKLAEKGLLEAEDGQLKAPNVNPELMELITKRQVPYKSED